MGGADNDFWSQGILLDSSVARHPGGASLPHLWLDSMTKSNFGKGYVTCEGPWYFLQGDGHDYNTGSPGGGNTGLANTFDGQWRIEGRNAGAPCFGNLIRVTGGGYIFLAPWLAYCMSAPTTNALSPQSAGGVHVTDGGYVKILGGTYDRANGVAEATPVGYANGANAHLRVTDMDHGDSNALWTGLPRVEGAAGADVQTDKSVSRVGTALLKDPPLTSIQFFKAGNQTIAPLPEQHPIRGDWIIRKVMVIVRTAPTGAPLIYDVNINGTTVWSTQTNRVQINVSTLSASQTVFNTSIVPDGSVISVDCDFIGTSVPGADATIVVWLEGI
jgi:hypothetical protein